MNASKITKAIFSAIATIFVFTSAHAAIYIIDAPAVHYPTIQAAIDAAASGDIIIVDPGTYDENVTLKPGIFLFGPAPDLATINGQGASETGGNPTVTMAEGSHLRGFKITGGYVGISSRDVTAVIMNNVVTDNYLYGISLVADAASSEVRSRVINNTIVDNLQGGTNLRSTGIYIEDQGANTVAAPIIMNNIVTGHTTGISPYDSIGNLLAPYISYNNVWGNETNYGFSYPQPATDISVDPSYANMVNYQLSAGSPCIDAGHPAYQFQDEGTRNDMGAYGGPGNEGPRECGGYESSPPVACYFFNGDAIDGSGNGYNGTVSFATPTDDRDGIPYSAYYFDGVFGVIFMDQDKFTTSNNISFAAWIKVDGPPPPEIPPPTQHFISCSDFIVSQRTATAEVAFAISREPSGETNSSKADIPYGQWFHFAGTYDGNTIRAYVNGSLAEETSWPGLIYDTVSPLNFGWFGSYWKGYVDDALIYDRVLSPAEIQQLAGKDLDGDGMDDAWENTHFGNLSHDGFGDTDNDGLNDLGEFENSTDPNNNDSDGDLMSDGYEFYEGTDPNDNTDFPDIPVQGAITHVHRPDGLFTYLETVISSTQCYPDVGCFEAFTGNLGPIPNDIDAVRVSGPGGVIAEYPPSTGWEYLPNWKDFFIALPGSPALGTYTFAVEVNLPNGSTLSGSATDQQKSIRILPIPDYNTFTPAWDSTLSLKDPTFSWDLVEYLEGGSPIPLYYRLEINEPQPGGPRVFANPYPLQQDMDSYTLGVWDLNPGRRYRDRVRVYDHPDWILADNRAHNTWVYFNTESDPARIQHFHALVFRSSGNPTGVLSSAFVVVPGYKDKLQNAALTTPGRGTYTFSLVGDKIDWNVPCRWINLWAHDFGNVQAGDYGEYTLTVEFSDGATETYTYDLQYTPMQGMLNLEVDIYDDGGAGVFWDNPLTGNYYYEVRLRDSENKEYFRYPSALNIDSVYLSWWDLRCLKPGEEYRWLVRAYDGLHPKRNAAWTEEIPMIYSPPDLTHTTWYGALSWRGQLAVGLEVRPGSWDDLMIDPAVVDPVFVQGPGAVFTGEPDPTTFIYNLTDDWSDISTETRINRSWWFQDPGWALTNGDYTFSINIDEDGNGLSDTTESFTDTLTVAAVSPVTVHSITVNEQTGAATVDWVDPVPGQIVNIRIRSVDGSKEYYRSPNVEEGVESVTASWWDLRGLEPGQYTYRVRSYSPDFKTMDELPPTIFDYYPFDADDDGFVDAFDNCPAIVNDQTDTDGDGAGDACDAFINDQYESLDTDGDGTGNNADLDDDGDGLSDIEEGDLGTDPLNDDTDGDGALDGSDNCPLTVNNQNDADDDGVGDACDVCPDDPDDDIDGDGYCADVDNCPDVWNPPGSLGQPQPDLDTDGLGNACDPDADDDGFGYVNFSETCCGDYWAVYNGVTGDWLREYNEGDSLGANEIRGGDCNDGDEFALPGVGDCPALAKGGKPGAPEPGDDPATDDVDADGRADAQEVTTLVKLTDTLTNNADTDTDGVSDGSGTGPDGDLTPDDNCPRTPNPGQKNTDGDLADAVAAAVGMTTKGGDACDTDVDNDGRADKRLTNTSGLLVFENIANTPNGDNCPLTPNADQINSDSDQLGDACDPDADNDGFCKEAICPEKDKIYTFDLRTGVVTATGTSCGGTLGPNEICGGDCNDTRSDVNPGEEEIAGDALDNDCNPGTADSQYEIQVDVTVSNADGSTFSCTSSGGHPCANWLPKDGDTITLNAGVTNAANVAVNFTVEEVTRFPGAYINDDSEVALLPANPVDPCTACAQDFAVTGTGNQRVLDCQDYGGYIRIQMTANDPNGNTLTPVIISFPQDANTNYIADEWERQLAPELAAAQAIDPGITGFTQNGDNDFIVVDSATGELNSTRGDGLCDHCEYRGGFWGPGVVDAATGFQKHVQTSYGAGELYQTPALLPMGSAGHFRMNPFRPDVFVKFYNYSVIADGRANPASLFYDPPYPLTPGDLAYAASCGVDCPFAFGTALDNVGVDVHLARALAAAGQPEAVGEENIDVLVMTNDTDTTFGSETGHILRFGKRSWLTGTLGDCPVGNGGGFGPVIDPDPCRTFARAIGYWYTDSPYRDGGRDNTIAGADQDGLLNAIDNRNRVEDKDDDGVRDGGEGSIINDGWLDGDVYLRNEIAAGDYEAGDASTYDIDMDGLIELPTLFGPEDLINAKEYTRAHTFKTILTHEAVHGLGAGHTQVPTCLMFANVNELDKDNNLSSDALRDLDLFNGRSPASIP